MLVWPRYAYLGRICWNGQDMRIWTGYAILGRMRWCGQEDMLGWAGICWAGQDMHIWAVYAYLGCAGLGCDMHIWVVYAGLSRICVSCTKCCSERQEIYAPPEVRLATGLRSGCRASRHTLPPPPAPHTTFLTATPTTSPVHDLPCGHPPPPAPHHASPEVRLATGLRSGCRASRERECVSCIHFDACSGVPNNHLCRIC
jgi:hypothetical protein